jgi:hypothetical protein
MNPIAWLLSKLFSYPRKNLGENVVALSISATTRGTGR